MPKIDLDAVPEHRGSGYPRPFDAPCAQRIRRRLGDAGGLRDFGVNLMRVPPGGWPARRTKGPEAAGAARSASRHGAAGRPALPIAYTESNCSVPIHRHTQRGKP